MSAQQLITEHIDLWTSTIKARKTQGRGSSKKRELYGIKKLRELILELAVRGKLVEQDPSDEPASVLLERIAKEKAQLVKDKKIKKQKALPEITEEEKPFQLPRSWSWQRFTDAFYPISVGQNKIKTSEIQEKGGIPVVDQGQSFIAGYTDKENLLIKLPGPVIIFRDHTSSLKYVDSNFIAGADGVKILRPICCNESYFYLVSKTLPIENRGYGRHYSRFIDNFFPLPPLEEQPRVVAKVDELMALCDQLEQQTESSLDAHNLLVDTLLSTLTNARNAKELSDSWARFMATDGLTTRNAGSISGSQSVFDTLITTDYAVEQLKQTILQLAVMGKLVPQDPNDEPASELLKRIAAEKTQLIKDKKIKKQQVLPVITNEEKPFELPGGWEWVRLEALSRLITKGSSPKWQGVAYTENPDDVLFVTSENVGVNQLLLENKKYVERKFNQLEPRSKLLKGDLLMNIVGGSIGRAAIYDIEVIANINQAVCLIRVFADFIDKDYLLKFFNSEICRGYMFDKQVDNARANLSMGNISKFIIPFPSLNEQHRIVTKVDELMALCEQLKAQLNDAQTTQLHLSDAVVESALIA